MPSGKAAKRQSSSSGAGGELFSRDSGSVCWTCQNFRLANEFGCLSRTRLGTERRHFGEWHLSENMSGYCEVDGRVGDQGVWRKRESVRMDDGNCEEVGDGEN